MEDAVPAGGAGSPNPENNVPGVNNEQQARRFNADNFAQEKPQLRDLAKKAERLLRSKLFNQRDFEGELKQLVTAGEIEPEDARRLAAQVYGDESIEAGIGKSDRTMHLQAYDLALLRDPKDGWKKWIEGKLKTIYEVSQNGNESDSPLMRDLQSAFGEAIAELREGVLKNNPKELAAFTTDFYTRTNLLFTRSAVEQKNMEGLQGISKRLTSEGLFYGLGMDDAKVGFLFGRIGDLAETMRLTEGDNRHHFSPAMVTKIQERTIAEQIALARKGANPFWDLTQEGLLRNEASTLTETEKKAKMAQNEERVLTEMTRACRAAYDEYVATQRQAVTTARGIEYKGDRKYESDPSGLFNVFNVDALLVDKFDLLNAEQQQFRDEVQLRMADTHLIEKGIDPKTRSLYDRQTIGKRLFRDFFTVPDFFSSGWRINIITRKIQEVVGYKMLAQKINPKYGKEKLPPEEMEKIRQEIQRIAPKGIMAYIEDEHPEPDQAANVKEMKKAAEDLALFMRLKKASAKGDKGLVDQRQAWQKIAYYRPEEVLRAFKEASASKSGDVTKKREEDTLGDVYKKFTALTGGRINNYADFKRDYGAILGTLRGEALRQVVPQQLDILKLDATQKDRINKALRKEGDPQDYDYAQELTNLYKAMHTFILPSSADQQKFDNFAHGIKEKEKEIEEAIKKHKKEGAKKNMEGFPNAFARKRFYDKLEELEKEEAYLAKKIVAFEENEMKKKDKINELLRNPEYAHITTRTITVDDAILDQIERTPEDSGIVAVSKEISFEKGGDSYARSLNDMKNCQDAVSHLVDYLMKEPLKDRIEAGEAFAEKVAAYNGAGARAACVDATVGVLFEASELPLWADALGVQKLPFRIPLTRIQEIYGPQAETLNRIELREMLDHVRTKLVDNAGELNDEERMLPADLQDKIRNEKKHHAEKLYLRLESRLSVDVKGRFQKGAWSLLIWLIFAAIIETKKILEEASDTASGGGGKKGGGGHH